MDLKPNKKTPDGDVESDLGHSFGYIEEPHLRNEKLLYQDPFFIFVFIAIFVGYIMCWFHITDISSLASLLNPSTTEINSSSTFNSPILSLFIVVILATTITVSITSLIILNTSHYKILMQSAFVVNSLIFITFSVYSFMGHNIRFGLVSLLMGLATLLCMKSVTPKFERSALMLEITVNIFKQYYSFYMVAIFGSLLSLIFLFSWIILLSQIYYKWEDMIKSQSDSYYDINMILLTIYSIFSGMYITEVIRNVTIVSISGIYGSWYYNKRVLSLDTYTSIKNSITCKFGSICLGSLVVSLLEFTNQSIEFVKSFITDRGSLLHLLLLILSIFFTILERLLKYFNIYVFSYVALYGDSFIKSSQEIVEVFRQRGWSIVINDCIIETTLKMYALITGFTSGACCYIYLWVNKPELSENNGTFMLLYSICGFFIAAQLSMVLYTVIIAGNNTLILALGIHPQVFQNRGPSYNEQFLSLKHLWPELLDDQTESV